ncbi:MAG: two-component system sensor histidine kinase/response regulator [Confluentimicrobium sp.]|nr:two-component system sensor histidine kinase/response regulator [Actibacterium sp.]
MTPGPQPDTQYQVDLTNCDRDPIHIIGAVQSFGCLIAVSSDWIVQHASDNVADILGLPDSDLVGLSLNEFLSQQALHDLRGKVQVADRTEAVARMFGYDLFDDGRLFDVALHRSNRSMVFEFEPAPASRPREDLSFVQPMMRRVAQRETLEGMCQEATRSLRALTGFDRVMCYRFAADGCGEVIAETVTPGREPFLGLRYPASDIPQQARELYIRNPLRLVVDIDAPRAEIRPTLNPHGEPLDLSQSVTRALSPIHLEYLRNMGVRASMSVSILRKGKLWGLFACHHYDGHYIDFELRTAVELFAQIFSYELSQSETELELSEITRARGLHDRLMARISDGASLADEFGAIAEDISSVIAHDGIAIYSEGRYEAHGSAPTEEEFLGLARFLNTATPSSVFATDALSEIYPAAAGFTDRVAGLLALPVSRQPRDYIVLFRREVARSVRWAGNPDKAVTLGPNGARLTPRKSFEAWQQIVKGKSAPWLSSEWRAADALRITLLEVVLKMSDEAGRERQRAQEQQGLLIAELNHRIRNILNLIQGLMSQSRASAESIQEYTAVLGDRIQALARAHDQLTREDWSSASLRELIEVEMKAFHSDRTDRVSISGPDVMISPEAFSTLALVFHELVTNSSKYGALSQGSGRVEIVMERGAVDELTVHWKEIGGPPVQPPTRRGFGTTIIERSIPYELKGEAQLSYKVGGVEGRFTVPARYIAAFRDPARPGDGLVPVMDLPGGNIPGADDLAVLSGEVMVLEDNMVIALDAEDFLKEMGAETVHVAGSVKSALEIANRVRLSYAMLDVNLGDATSVDVARLLREQGVPFILATGYGGNEVADEGFGNAPVVKKPYSTSTIRAAFARL